MSRAEPSGIAALIKDYRDYAGRALDPRPAALVVAHRATTLARCDRIIAIRDGKVEESSDPTYLGA